MKSFPKPWRLILQSVLWLWIGLTVWLRAVQAFLVMFSPTGSWQLPGWQHVAVIRVEVDQEGKLTGGVLARREDREVDLKFSQQEALGLAAGDELWVLNNYFVGGARPDHFRLTPIRVLLEYPEPLALLALGGILLLRRGQRKEEQKAQEPPPGGRKVWKDDFHARAERFAAAKSDPDAPSDPT